MKDYLYRGVSFELHQKNNGILVPKATGPFKEPAIWGELVWGSGETWGETIANAVIRHQRDQKGIPTSGVSTTPHFNRAQFYATHGGLGKSGVIYKIDRSKLSEYGVSEYIVKNFASHPSVPEDEEVILVSKDCGPLPVEIVVDIHIFK